LDLISLGLYRSALATHAFYWSRSNAGGGYYRGAETDIETIAPSTPIIHRRNSPVVFFLRNWIVNNARHSTSIRHDKTLQMNIDNGACLFLTAIYNVALFTNDNKTTVQRTEPYPDYNISFSSSTDECLV